jgi:hypothetical protein
MMEDIIIFGGLFPNEATVLAATSVLLCFAVAWVLLKNRINSTIKPAMDPEKFQPFRLSKVVVVVEMHVVLLGTRHSIIICRH